jgi:hypothetical protein
MPQKNKLGGAPPDVLADPFCEDATGDLRHRFCILGMDLHVETSDPQLLRAADAAFGGLPAHRLSAAARGHLGLAWIPQTRRALRRSARQPHPLRFLSTAGSLCAVGEGSTFVCVTPAAGSAVVAASPRYRQFPYHLRYELIELAGYLLAARTLGLVPLHAACVSYRGRGALLMGSSGSGKSTATLHCAADGLDFLAEDSVLVEPRTARATGLANYLHLRSDSLRYMEDRQLSEALRASPSIHRRSGVAKLEIDMRRTPFRLAPKPPRIATIVFLSTRSASGGPLLLPLRKEDAARRLRLDQPYAARQPGWTDFMRLTQRVDAFELRRGHHPRESAEALRMVLGSTNAGARAKRR